MTGHTKGPWKAGQYLGSPRWVVHMDVGDKGRGMDIVDAVCGSSPEQRIANALLIATAPELLDLARVVAANPVLSPMEEFGVRARALIAKATGEQS